MAEQSDALQLMPTIHGGDGGVNRRLSFSSEKSISAFDEPSTTCSLLTLQSFSDESSSCRPSVETDEEQPTEPIEICLNSNNAADVKGAPLEEHGRRDTDDKENYSEPLDVIESKLAFKLYVCSVFFVLCFV